MAIYEDTAPHNRVIYWYKVCPLENVNRALKMLYLKDGPETGNKLIAINVAITEDSVIDLNASAANLLASTTCKELEYFRENTAVKRDALHLNSHEELGMSRAPF